MNSFRNQPRISFLWWLLILTALLWSGCEPARDQARMARMDRLDLMADADMLVRCSDTSALLAALEQSPLGRFWNSPDMAAFRNGRSLEEEIRLAMVDENDGENGAKIGDIYLEQAKMIHGEFILGLDFSAFDGTQP